jgi:hypothetical protein
MKAGCTAEADEHALTVHQTVPNWTSPHHHGPKRFNVDEIMTRRDAA